MTKTNSSTPAAQKHKALRPLPYVCLPLVYLGPIADLMQYDMTFSRDFTGSDTMPSPDVEGEEGSLSPHDQTSATQLKPAAKRKRENRYKNAPPSVLSVSPQPAWQEAPLSHRPRTAYPTKPAVKRSQADVNPPQTAPPSTKPRLAKSLPGAQGPADQGPRADAQ